MGPLALLLDKQWRRGKAGSAPLEPARVPEEKKTQEESEDVAKDRGSAEKLVSRPLDLLSLRLGPSGKLLYLPEWVRTCHLPVVHVCCCTCMLLYMSAVVHVVNVCWRIFQSMFEPAMGLLYLLAGGGCGCLHMCSMGRRYSIRVSMRLHVCMHTLMETMFGVGQGVGIVARTHADCRRGNEVCFHSISTQCFLSGTNCIYFNNVEAQQTVHSWTSRFEQPSLPPQVAKEKRCDHVLSGNVRRCVVCLARRTPSPSELDDAEDEALRRFRMTLPA
jgi:hypothetical protein